MLVFYQVVIWPCHGVMWLFYKDAETDTFFLEGAPAEDLATFLAIRCFLMKTLSGWGASITVERPLQASNALLTMVPDNLDSWFASNRGPRIQSTRDDVRRSAFLLKVIGLYKLLTFRNKYYIHQEVFIVDKAASPWQGIHHQGESARDRFHTDWVPGQLASLARSCALGEPWFQSQNCPFGGERHLPASGGMPYLLAEDFGQCTKERKSENETIYRFGSWALVRLEVHTWRGPKRIIARAHLAGHIESTQAEQAVTNAILDLC
jgi:hypothetical protein